MKSVAAFASLVLTVLAAFPAAAAPPPPAPLPPELEQPIDGYRLEVLYQLWRHWVEGRKGPIIEAELDKPAPPPGERPFGPRQLRFKGSGDLGQFVGGDAQVYCKPHRPYGFDSESCHIVLRKISIPVAVAGHGAQTSLSRWLPEHFDAQGLVRHLKAEGLAPDTDWWWADRARLFAASASPDAALKAELQVQRVDSRDCPAMAKAFNALDATKLDLRLDIFGVGQDTATTPPQPHANSWTVTLGLLREDGAVTFETGSRRIVDLVFPILRAADACATAAPPQQ